MRREGSSLRGTLYIFPPIAAGPTEIMVKTSSMNAVGIEDASVVTHSEGGLKVREATGQKGSTAFALGEFILCSPGVKKGDGLEAAAFKHGDL
jgi:hypothetical protein